MKLGLHHVYYQKIHEPCIFFHILHTCLSCHTTLWRMSIIYSRGLMVAHVERKLAKVAKVVFTPDNEICLKIFRSYLDNPLCVNLVIIVVHEIIFWWWILVIAMNCIITPFHEIGFTPCILPNNSWSFFFFHILCTCLSYQTTLWCMFILSSRAPMVGHARIILAKVTKVIFTLNNGIYLKVCRSYSYNPLL